MRRGVAEDRPVRWRSPIHMPHWASRLTLEIDAVRVERLNEISEADARAEGVFAEWPAWDGHEHESTREARLSFRELWEKIHGDAAWKANPFVWVLSFHRAEDR